MIARIIVVHHSAEKDTPQLDWPGIRRYQMSYRIDHVSVSEDEYIRRIIPPRTGTFFEKPWLDVGYHAGVELVLVGGDYEAIMGRPWDWDGAHTLWYNHEALGICFMGDYELYAPPEKMLLVGAKVISFWMRMNKIPKTEVYRHSDLNDTGCPGSAFDMNKLKALL